MNFAKFLLGLVLTSLLFSKEYLAVVDFSANNVSNSNVNALTQRLISSLIVLDKYQIIERSEMNKLLDEQKFQSSGCTSTQCAVDIGKLIGAKYVVVGSVGKIGSTYAVDARIIDVETGEALSSASYSHYGEIDQLLIEGIDQITAQLCGLEYKKEDLVLNASNEIDVSSKKNKKSSIFSYFTLGYINMANLTPSIEFDDQADNDGEPDLSPLDMSLFHLRPKALKNLQFKMHMIARESSYEPALYSETYQNPNDDNYESTTYMAFGYFLPIKRISKLSFSGNAWLYMGNSSDNSISAFAELSVQIETPKFLSFGLRPELGLRADFDQGLSLFFAFQFIEFSFGSNY